MGRTDAICNPLWPHLEKGPLAMANACPGSELFCRSCRVSGLRAFEVDVKSTSPGNATERSSTFPKQTLHSVFLHNDKDISPKMNS